MNNRIKDMIQKDIVDPAMRSQQKLIKGIVVEYSNRQNIANIKFYNPMGTGQTTAYAVPVHIGAVGVHSAGPEPGAEVWIEFINGDVTMPRIVGFVDENYELRTREIQLKHQRKGVYIPTILSEEG